MTHTEQALLRGWLRGLPAPVLARAFEVDSKAVKNRIQALRADLMAKARFQGDRTAEAVWQGQRPRTKQGQTAALASLDRLGGLTLPAPAPAHRIDQWLPQVVAEAARPWRTLAEFSQLAQPGYPWPEALQGQASLINRFLTAQAQGLGLAHHSRLPARCQGNLPGSLADETATAGEADRQAMAVWLQAKGNRSPRTFEAYERESRRFWLWLQEHQLTLASVRVSHLEQYYQHLATPPAHWLRPRKPKAYGRLSPTQTLIGPLRPAAIAYARTILSQLFSYLQQVGYVTRQPVALNSTPGVVTTPDLTRYLDPVA